jgi:RND family efflux transporter MFP subunit
MSRAKVIICSVLSVVLLAGVIGMHRHRRNQELVRQRALKQAALVPVTLATVQEHSFRGTVAFTGTLLAVNRADLKAEESGRVTRVTVQEGDRVRAGAVLCAQEEEDLLLSVQAAEAQLAQAQVQADQAGRDNERAQNLLAKRSVTKQAAQQAETAFNAALASVHAAESALGLARSHLRKSRITAPFAGEVASRLVQPGEMLAPGQPAFCLVDNRRLEIQADLPAQALARIRPGLKASFRVAGFDQPFPATLTQISASIQQDGRTLRVRLEAPNPDGRLRSGLFTEGEILIGGQAAQAALPSAILTAVGREADVYVAVQGVARRRRVLVGPEQDGWRPVEGLPAGTQVVAQGRDLVAEGTLLQSADAIPAAPEP